MDNEYKTYKHNPPHLFIPEAKYIISASTYKRIPLLRDDRAKDRLLDSLSIEFPKYEWTIEDWVILDDHYHLMADAPMNAGSLADIMREVHRFTALWINKNVRPEPVDFGRNARRVFQNYWDTCITYERSYFARINYIWFNPVKHGYVESPEEWKYGSYFYRFKDEYAEMQKQIKKYPFNSIRVKGDF
ncbi:MAG: transposase [FCB group bacterium]|nr:transposase [FCB group bacterium]